MASASSNRALHLIHLNINSLLQKIDLLSHKVKRTKVVVIGILEYKLDSTVLNPEIYIENYGILRSGRNLHEGGVACYIRSDISYKLNSFLPTEIENSTFNILMLHTKPIQLELFTDHHIKLNFLIFLKKIYLNSTQAIVKFTS